MHFPQVRLSKNKEELEYRNSEVLIEDMPGKSLFCRRSLV